MRGRSVFAVILLLACGFCESPVTADSEQMYGFVSYGGDEGNPLNDAALVIRSLGAAWHQSEGPATLSKGVCWGLVQPQSVHQYDWTSLDWVYDSAAAGVNILMAVTPGHDAMLVGGYSKWVDCHGSGPVWPTSNCPPCDYQNWYDFAYAVAQHFDGNHGAPEITHFMTTGENDDEHYWLGSVEEYYGGTETVTITRRNGLGDLVLPAALVPVFFRGVHDANPQAKVVVGACTAWRSYGWSQINEMIIAGEPEEEVVHQAKQYGLTESYDQLVDRIANDEIVGRSIAFFYPSIAAHLYYDYYGAHFYAPHGYADAMAYLKTRMAEHGNSRAVWMTGEGRLLNGTAEGHAKSADIHLRRIIYTHLAGIAWHDVSFLVDVLYVNCCGMYRQPDGEKDYPGRQPLADTFRMMAHLLPRADCATPRSVESPFPDSELYAFDIVHTQEGYAGSLAAGWCSNTCPELSAWGTWCAGDCPRPEIDLAGPLGIPAQTATVILDTEANILHRSNDGTAPVIFAERPFVVVWGADGDEDGIPDILDNCPEIPNTAQSNDPDEHLIGAGNPKIPAPDWIGDACDPCPDNGNPDCTGECSSTGVTLEMPAHIFRAGDPCYLDAFICNADGEPLSGYPLFVILDVFGEYWFAPDWTPEADYYVRNFPPGITSIPAIHPFVWPEGAGSASGLHFHGALTNPQITQLYGTMHSWSFSFE